MKTFYAVILSILVLTPFSARAQNLEPPFGVNNAFDASDGNTNVWLDELGVSWISDHLPRRDIEKINDDGVPRYDFDRVVGPLITEYAVERSSNAWFVINVESLYPFTDGRLIRIGSETGKYFPPVPSPSMPMPRFSTNSCAG